MVAGVAVRIEELDISFTLAGKQREMGLGAVHTVNLTEARVKAKECRQVLLDGKDPLDARRSIKQAEALERAKAMTFDQCAEAYIAAHRAGWKNAKHADQWETTLSSYASPIFGSLSVAEIDTALVVKVLGAIWEAKTETATRLRGRIEKILDGRPSASTGRVKIRRAGAGAGIRHPDGRPFRRSSRRGLVRNRPRCRHLDRARRAHQDGQGTSRAAAGIRHRSAQRTAARG